MSDDEGEVYHYSDEEVELSEEEGEEAGAGSAAASSAAACGAGARGTGAAAGGSGSRTAKGSKAGGGFGFSAAVPACGYRLLREDEVQGVQGAFVSEVASLLELPPECAKTLLIHFKWNKERLLDRYYADPAGLRAEAGIVHLGVSRAASAPFMCMICLEDTAAADGFALGCGHMFCRSCWSSFLRVAVSERGAHCIHAKCPNGACGEAVTSSAVMAMAPSEVAARWAHFELKHFVTVSKSMAVCPAAGCTNAFVAPGGAVRTAMCPCGMHFCFRCSREAHEPAACAQVDAWTEKCGSESETANWILANTKKCPKCSARIEKNQGCNHMKCVNKGCLYEFCWTCQGPWSEHGQTTGGFYSCNKFKGKIAPASDGSVSAAEKAKAELERYLFYYTRYSNHEAAGKFAARHRALTQRRMLDLAAMGGGLGVGGGGWEDATFLQSATEALLNCRRVLKYTYVVGFYMAEGAEKALFEHLQEQLERATEHLAELTEAPLEKVSRGDVLNYTRVTLQFLAHLLEGLEEGLT